ARQPDGHAIGFDVDQARRAVAQVFFEQVAAGGVQLAADEVEQQVGQLAAVGLHDTASSKCGARASRIISRARCSRLFTAGTLRSNMSPISAFASPSTSASTY